MLERDLRFRFRGNSKVKRDSSITLEQLNLNMFAKECQHRWGSLLLAHLHTLGSAGVSNMHRKSIDIDGRYWARFFTLTRKRVKPNGYRRQSRFKDIIRGLQLDAPLMASVSFDGNFRTLAFHEPCFFSIDLSLCIVLSLRSGGHVKRRCTRRIFYWNDDAGQSGGPGESVTRFSVTPHAWSSFLKVLSCLKLDMSFLLLALLGGLAILRIHLVNSWPLA